MFIIAFCLMADASILIFNPSLYRKSLEYVNDSLGPIWSILYGSLFLFCAFFIILSIILSGISYLYIIAVILMTGIGLFFLLSNTQKYNYFVKIWSSLTDIQYRIAGLVFIILSAIVCYITAKIRYH